MDVRVSTRHTHRLQESPVWHHNHNACVPLSCYFSSTILQWIRGLPHQHNPGISFHRFLNKSKFLSSCGPGSNSLSDGTDVYLCVCHTCHRVRIQPIKCERAKWLEGSLSPQVGLQMKKLLRLRGTLVVYFPDSGQSDMFMSRGSQKRIFEVGAQDVCYWRVIRTKEAMEVKWSGAYRLFKTEIF